jgi:hypothetical protein
MDSQKDPRARDAGALDFRVEVQLRQTNSIPRHRLRKVGRRAPLCPTADPQECGRSINYQCQFWQRMSRGSPYQLMGGADRRGRCGVLFRFKDLRTGKIERWIFCLQREPLGDDR